MERRNRFMRKSLLWMVLGGVVLWHAGCTGMANGVTGDVAAPTASPTAGTRAAETPAAATPGAETADAAEGASMLNLEELAVDGREQTLLTYIADAKNELAPLSGHRYVEMETANGALWQGEMLQTAAQRVYFLQVQGGDWQRAWRIETDAETEPTQLAAKLPDVAADLHPAPDVNVQAVQPQPGGSTEGGTDWRFSVTIAHPDTGWADYVDGWLVLGPDGEVLGTRILLHPHETEQPFSRSLSNVTIPATITHVTIRPHDLVSGYDEGMRIPLAVPQPTPTSE